MSRPDASFPSADEELLLHLRLCALDPVAPADACRAYLEPLLAWLEMGFPNVDADLRRDATHRALFAYIQCPAKYQPERGGLAAYLRVAAKFDLFNLLRDEKRHLAHRVAWQIVEDDPDAGYLSGKEPEPSETLARQEEREQRQALLRAVKDSCTPEERIVLNLMLAGERNDLVYAEKCGAGGLPIEEQRRHVKRLKDRIKKRLERGGRPHE